MAGAEIFDKAEIKAITDVIERKMIHRYGSHDFRKGQYRVDEFEEKAKAITGAKFALGVSSGTAALILALKGLGIKPGDEVITTPFTFIATIESIVACDAVPILGDIEETLGLDPVSVEKLITPRTKAIMPVHMFGVAADMGKFMELGNKYGIPIIEDACEVVGGTFKEQYLGAIGKCGTWSFDPNKTITVGEGGMVLTDDEAVYSKMEYYHDHGHVHSKVHDRGADAKSGLGVNYRLSEIQGALGLVALDKMSIALGCCARQKKRSSMPLRLLELRRARCMTTMAIRRRILFSFCPRPEPRRNFRPQRKKPGALQPLLERIRGIMQNTGRRSKSWATGISSAQKRRLMPRVLWRRAT